jgi:short subunit dehydrogenase-like uncharacterized protein
VPAPLDVVVLGATGFTGRRVAEYLNASYRQGRAVAWAIADRKLDKLAEVREQIGASSALPLRQADASDASALAALVARSRVVISTVGPCQLHGEPLVRACAHAGTDYVDLWERACAQRCGAIAIPATAQPASSSQKVRCASRVKSTAR